MNRQDREAAKGVREYQNQEKLRDMVAYLMKIQWFLDDWEAGFVENMQQWHLNYTEKQQRIIRKLWWKYQD